MSFFTRPDLDNRQFKQLFDSELDLSGTTSVRILRKLDGEAFQDGYVLTFNGTTKELELQPSASSGATLLDNVGVGVQLFVTGNTGTTSEIRTLSGGTGVFITQSGDTVVITSSGGVIGEAEDGTYDDGYFKDFTPDTPIGTPIDRFNELFALLLPQPAPPLDDINANAGVAGKLSFGSTKSIAGYTNVDASAGNPVIGLNTNYPVSGDRRGLFASGTITGTLNADVTDGTPAGIPYEDGAFADGDLGTLILYLNDVEYSTISLTGTTAATSNANFNLSEIKLIKFDNGNALDDLKYRTGTYSIPSADWRKGFNFARIVHSGTTTGDQVTNYVEWVYDPALSGDNITISSEALAVTSLSGSKFISGVEYYTAGEAEYTATYANVYKNVFSNLTSAISFPVRNNLSNFTSLDISGAGIVNVVGQANGALPNLTTVAGSENTDIDIVATFNIDNNTIGVNTDDVIVGNVAPNGAISTNSRVRHPFSSNDFNGGNEEVTGFLIYSVNQTSNNSNENFTGEADRLQDQDYTVLTYANINGGLYDWDSTESLTGASALHNSGLLVFNGELLYPSASRLTSQYGITLGDFSSITNAPAGNPDYTFASGVNAERNYYRLFKSENTVTQSTLSFRITHNGNVSNFLTDGGDSGTPTGNNIKFEFLIKRANGNTHGWANPFASLGNPEGIAGTSASHSGGVTTVTCTLSTNPRVANTDIVIVRVKVGSGYAANANNRISNIEITNIG
jgi:hypothetical protein